MVQTIQSLRKLLQEIVEVNQSVIITGISNDSRRLQVGDLFIAILGEAVDARDFILSAIEQGVAAIIYEDRDHYSPPKSLSVPLFPVKYLDQCQGVIASRFYQEPSQAMRCVGITGTNGKTSCAQWITQALTNYGISCGMMGTLGVGFLSQLDKTTHTTLDPILLQAVLARLHMQGAEAVAMEVSSHALAQHRLNGMCFDVAVFTQLSQDHLDYHDDMKHYAKAKKRLFEWESLKAAVINIDDSVGALWASQFSRKYPVITYSLNNSKAVIFASNIKPEATGFSMRVHSPWGSGPVHLPFWGLFNVSNVLAVLGVLAHFDLPFLRALECLESLSPVPGRMQILGGGEKNPIVVVDYAHTPDALKNTLQALREHTQGQLWCVFGCGGHRDRSKRAKMAKTAEYYSDQIVVTNDNPRTESPEQIVDDIMSGFSSTKPWVEMDRAKAIAYVIQKAATNDLILVAGKGHETYQIIGENIELFSDQEHIKQLLLQRASAA